MIVLNNFKNRKRFRKPAAVTYRGATISLHKLPKPFCVFKAHYG